MNGAMEHLTKKRSSVLQDTNVVCASLIQIIPGVSLSLSQPSDSPDIEEMEIHAIRIQHMRSL